MSSSNINKHSHKQLILCIVCLAFLIVATLTLMHTGLLPTVFADEWEYSRDARLTSALSHAITPAYLYLLLFKSTNFCGSAYLSCARFINACLFTFALPFIYLVARQVMSRSLALFIAVVSLLGPINTYTAYFVPEAMYFFSFWVFTLISLAGNSLPPRLYASALGLILSAMSLIKPHALFLIPAISLFLFFQYYFRLPNAKLRTIMKIMGCLIVVFITSRLLLGYLLAGKQGLNFIGNKYSYNAASLLLGGRLLHILQTLPIPFMGHLMALLLLFALPITLLLTGLKRRHRSVLSRGFAIQKIQLFTLSCLIPLFFLTIVTTAEIVGWSPYETINRIHLRYYNFIFPLFFIIAGAEYALPMDERNTLSDRLLILFLSTTLLFLLSQAQNYLISFIDCPELYALLDHSQFFVSVISIAFISLLAFSIKKKWGAAIYTFLYFPVVMLISSYYVHHELWLIRRNTTDVYDRAGLYAARYLKEKAAKLAIIGPERAGLYKTLFYLDNINATIIEWPLNTPIEFANIPRDKTWLLLIGDYPSLRKPKYKLAMQEYSVIELAPMANFSRISEPNPLH